MNRMKAILGLVLVFTALICIFLWETVGRENLILEEVITTTSCIPKGTIVAEKMFKTTKIMKENISKGSIKPKEINSIIGKKAKQTMPENSQISLDFFYYNQLYLNENESIFPVKEEWIYAMSLSLRRGDEIEIYTDDGELINQYFKVAFVKDKAGREVKTIDESEDGEAIERTDGTSVGVSLEIIGSVYEYLKILEKIREGESLLIVQKIVDVYGEK